MAPRLNAYVTLNDPETGEPVTFGPDTKTVPGWAQDQITNPSVWVEQEVSEDEEVGEVVADDFVRQQLLQQARDLEIEVPHDATKETIAAMIRRHEFLMGNPDAELTGDDPVTLAATTITPPPGEPVSVESTSGRRSRRQKSDEGSSE